MKPKFDQFYTNPKIADKLVKKLFFLLPNVKNKIFIEPAAGCGNFIDALINHGIDEKNIIALDIDPKKDKRIKKKDYLKEHIEFNENHLIIGNPPFGRRGKMAIEFINKGLNEGNFVAMIVPKMFTRYSVQKQIKHDAKLIHQTTLDKNIFLVNNKQYDVNSIFQIWVNKSTPNILAIDQRIKKPLDNKIDDFSLFIHNNTKQTLKYFNKKKYKWDYAVARQGYYDYKKKIKTPNKLVENRQYLFIKPNNKKAEIILQKINFKKLANSKNTTILGFSNTDLISEYKKFLNYYELFSFKQENTEKFNKLIFDWNNCI